MSINCVRCSDCNSLEVIKAVNVLTAGASDS